jgi:undecaprenyl-diphosphatase
MTFNQILDLDNQLSSKLRLPPGKNWLWKISAFMAHSGDSWFWMAGLGILWLINQEARRSAFLMAFDIGLLAVIVLGIKFLVRRQRPEGEWGAIYRNHDPHSFPSGHAARAAMLIVVAWALCPVWLALIITLWAPFVSISRVITGVHYLSDVIAGSLLGFVAGFILLQTHPLLATIFWFFV